MSDQTTDEAPPPRPFTQFALEQRKGAMHVQLSEALRDAVSASVDLGKQSTITLVLKIAPSKSGENVEISDQIKVKKPEPEAGSSTYFVDEHGDVSRNNPQQDELPLRSIDTSEAAEPRRIGETA